MNHSVKFVISVPQGKITLSQYDSRLDYLQYLCFIR